VLEFFIEGGRSRSGKVLRPKMGMLSVITNTVLEGQVDDAMIVPVAISYDKVPTPMCPVQVLQRHACSLYLSTCR
jgi:glycerol-3-phosphate O-acyltransferase